MTSVAHALTPAGSASMRSRPTLGDSAVAYQGRLYFAVLLKRIARHIETLDAIVYRTAAELCAAGLTVDEALEVVDARSRELQLLLGERSR